MLLRFHDQDAGSIPASLNGNSLMVKHGETDIYYLLPFIIKYCLNLITINCRKDVVGIRYFAGKALGRRFES